MKIIRKSGLTPAGAAAKDAAIVRKTQTEVAFIGDSITEQNDSINASTSYILTGAGYPNWTAYHLNGRIRLLTQSKTLSRVTFGVSGFKIHQIRGTLITNYTTRTEKEILGSNSPLANMLGRIAKRKVLVVDLSGANDVTDTVTYTAAEVALKRRRLWEEMIVCGVLPADIVAIALLPYGGTTTTAFADAINAININDAAALGINWMPYPAVFKSAGAANSSYYRDGIHPNKIGAFLIGQALAAVLSPKVTADRFELPISTSARWLSPNPYVTGTQAVSGTRYSGSIATGGWTVGGSVLANTSVELSKYTDSEGEWQRFVVTGTERDGGLGLSNNISTPIPAGTRYRLVARVRSTGFYNYQISCVQNSSSQAVINQESSDLVASNPLDLPAFDGVLYSPVMVAIGGLGISAVAFNTKGQGTLDIRQVGILRDDEEDLLTDDQGGSIVTRGFNNTPALPAFDCTVMISGQFAITQALPDALLVHGRRYLFVRTDASATTITIDPSGSQTINGATTFVFAASTSQYQRLHIQAFNGNWIIIGQ
jgi:lysophospholipase L1-like esterase